MSEWNEEHFIDKGREIDAVVSEYILKVLESKNYPEQAYKSCLGILSFERKVGKERLINACKRALEFNSYSYKAVQKIREKISRIIISDEEYHIIDSMPLEICKMSRKNRLKICKEEFTTSPNEGFCASQQTRYYGYKLHAVCTIQGVFRSFDLSKASVHDIHYLHDVENLFSNVTILGDKGYLSKQIQIDLFNYHKIKLEVPMRKNQKDYKEQPYLLRKSRKRIETLFSQLCDQFNIRNNYAKTFQGFKTRILAKITALTVIQLINKQNNRNINNLKISIA
ncbi:IS982 family transposase [Chryseobacterium sp.]|uniref:IS982 family transposase n=1 Tax=Chryseobacterium sp. TaxID=1871047 RepID=UPI003FA53469